MYVKIKKIMTHSELPGYIKLVFFLYFFTLFNRDLRYIHVVWYTVNIATLAATLFYSVQKDNFEIRLNFYFIWIVLFSGWGLLSYIWALNPDYVVSSFGTIILCNAVFYLMYKTISNSEDLICLLKIILISAIATSFCILILSDVKAVFLSGLRLGVDATGKNWNANDIGLFAAKAVLLAVCFSYSHWKKNINIISFILLSSMVVMSGSRKALIVYALYIILFSIFKTKKGRLKNILIAFASVLVLYFFITENNMLYNLIGKRIEAMVTGMFLGGTSEGSFNVHDLLIQYGKTFFWQSPIIGHGLMNYRVLISQITPWELCAHNNYIELLVDLGGIGFVLYYSSSIYILSLMIKNKLYKINQYALVIFIFIICDFFVQTACVCFDDPACTMIIMLGMTSVKIWNNRPVMRYMEVSK